MPEVLEPIKVPNERRRYPRISVKMALSFKSLAKGEISRTVKSESEDLSAGGLAMRTQLKMRRGQLLMLNLFLPVSSKPKKTETILDFTKSACQTAAVLSRVAHCTKVQDVYRLGVQFLDLDNAHRRMLKNFLVKHQLLKPGSKLYS